MRTRCPTSFPIWPRRSRRIRSLQVLALNGYHDLATPFFQTERDLARLGNVPNVQSTFYRGGHMTYLDDASRALEKADLVRFYQRAALSP